MTALLPIMYLIVGLLAEKLLPALKQPLATLLSTVLIPIVIVYNIIYARAEHIILILFGFFICTSLFLLYSAFNQDKLKALCFSYLNIGWLGLPFAISVFGHTASLIIISIYIGSSIFGNAFAVMALQPSLNLRSSLVNSLKAPAIIAIVIGLVIRLFDLYQLIQPLLHSLYDIAKIGMSFAGMCILGMWLYHSKITLEDLKASLQTSLYRVALSTLLIAALFFIAQLFDLTLITKHIAIIFMVALLPPAANIVALETHYLHTGHSTRYIASGTVISLVLLLCYALILSLLKFSA